MPWACPRALNAQGALQNPEESALRAAAKSTTEKGLLEQNERLQFRVGVSGEVTSPPGRPCFVIAKAGNKSLLAGFLGGFSVAMLMAPALTPLRGLVLFPSYRPPLYPVL